MKPIKRAKVIDKHLNYDAKLPYNLKVEEIRRTLIAVYDFLYKLNTFLLANGYDRIEDLILGNSLSGILSEVLVKNIADNTKTLDRNEKIGGHPDLIPKGMYTNNAVLRGKEGVEIKTSKAKGGWQGHNPERCWIVIFRYVLDDKSNSPFERKPIEFVQVLAAELTREDWISSGRSDTSRRTATASINARGVDKLRSNPIYQHPRYVVATNTKSKIRYRSIVINAT